MIKGRLELGETLPNDLHSEVSRQLPFNLPKSYLNFVKEHNGAWGDLPIQPFCFYLWKFEEIIQSNDDYKVQEFLPNYYGIGSNRGGELIAISLQNGRIVAIPFIPMDADAALLIAESFDEFEKIIGFADENI